MKLIIDIPEEVYKKAKETHDVMCDKVWLGIKYGTPLDDLKADLHATAEMHSDGDYYLHDEWIDEYFDNIGKAESEV